MKKWLAALGIPVISGLVILFATKMLESPNGTEILQPSIVVFEATPENGVKSTIDPWGQTISAKCRNDPIRMILMIGVGPR